MKLIEIQSASITGYPDLVRLIWRGVYYLFHQYIFRIKSQFKLRVMGERSFSLR